MKINIGLVYVSKPLIIIIKVIRRSQLSNKVKWPMATEIKITLMQHIVHESPNYYYKTLYIQFSSSLISLGQWPHLIECILFQGLTQVKIGVILHKFPSLFLLCYLGVERMRHIGIKITFWGPRSLLQIVLSKSLFAVGLRQKVHSHTNSFNLGIGNGK